jgi:hypothetical protein
LEKTGLLAAVSKQYWRIQPYDLAAPSEEGAVIAADSPYSFLVYPEIAYNDVITLASFSRVTEAGAAVRFELNRDYVMRAFNQGMSADTMIALLQRLSHNRIDENLIFTLRDWEKRHGEVRLLNGIVLTLAPERRYLTQTQPLAGLITETLAPGIYLLPQEAEEKAAAALRKAGAVIFTGQGKSNAKAGFADAGGSPHTLSGNFYQTLGSSLHNTGGNLKGTASQKHREHAATSEGATPEGDTEKKQSASTLIDSFRSILEKMPVGGEERDELGMRIDRRMILCESQLKDAVIRYEKLEARGLDYSGKVLIARQAISLQTPVEIYLSGRKKNNRHLP